MKKKTLVVIGEKESKEDMKVKLQGTDLSTTTVISITEADSINETYSIVVLAHAHTQHSYATFLRLLTKLVREHRLAFDGKIHVNRPKTNGTTKEPDFLMVFSRPASSASLSRGKTSRDKLEIKDQKNSKKGGLMSIMAKLVSSGFRLDDESPLVDQLKEVEKITIHRFQYWLRVCVQCAYIATNADEIEEEERQILIAFCNILRYLLLLPQSTSTLDSLETHQYPGLTQGVKELLFAPMNTSKGGIIIHENLLLQLSDEWRSFLNRCLAQPQDSKE